MGIIERLFGVNAKAKAMLRKLPIRDKASTIKEVKGWNIGDYGGVNQVQIKEAADIIAHGIKSHSRLRVVCQDDRILVGNNPSYPSGVTKSEKTIFRISKDEFVVHTYFDTGGH